MGVFAVLTLPRPRTLRLVCLIQNEFQASISYAFAGDAAVWLKVGASGFRVIRSRGLDLAMFRDAEFRAAIRAAIAPRPEPPANGLSPPGTKTKRDGR
jgi:hypothetical protein